MDLFDRNIENAGETGPLAARLRATTLDEFVGQEHIVGEGRFLRVMLERDQIPSMIFWGPPGCGKTTLGSVIAKSTRSTFIHYSAVLGSVKEIRTIIEKAKQERKFYRRQTILFVDEIHRFNKSQQDAFLPFVEKGIITLIGATTENPSFEVNAALLSRSKVVVLKPLEPEHLEVLLERALSDAEHGFAGLYTIDDEAKFELINGSSGDARRALTSLESTCEFAAKEGENNITLKMVQEAQQRKSLLYDKGGDEHYNVISAFIKSMRGSDPNAAIYWMMRMLESGEDPMFILRRMMIFAAEDIGLANPQALQVAVAAQQAFHLLGLPEGKIPMSEAVAYLATSEKSNSSYMAMKKAEADVRDYGPLPVPMHLRNVPTKLMKNLGYSKGYKYPHNYDGNFVSENYLPEKLKNRVYFVPGENGEESQIKASMKKREKDKKSDQE